MRNGSLSLLTKSLKAGIAVFGVCAWSAAAAAAADTTAQQTDGLRSKIQHIIVIYQENWSFDGLYSKFPGANGATTVQPQLQFGTVDPHTQTCTNPGYVPMPKMAQQPLLGAASPAGPWPCGWVDPATGVFSVAKAGGSNPDPPFSGIFAGGGGLPVAPFDLSQYDPNNTLTGDIWHIFWHEQLQIDNGALEPPNGEQDKFVAYSSNPGYVLSAYDATNLPEGKIAQHYTLADNFFHSVFGGSYLNHMWLACACTPQWNQPMPVPGEKGAANFVSRWNPTTKALNDGNLTLMPTPAGAGTAQPGQYWVVNTTLTQNNPHDPRVPPDQLLAPIPPAQKTIGDLLTDANPSVTWKWYSGGWNLALSDPAAAATCQKPAPGAVTNNPPASGECFQFHHQPFAYFQRWGSSSPDNFKAHLQDEQNFYSDLKDETLPSVAFVKPVGVDNEHPNYSALIAGQTHVQQLLSAVCNSKYWASSAVIIAYDENGGRWDHVHPPAIDQWGPGDRVPAIIVSPYARAGFVDHTQYETASILALIERRFDLPSLNARDAKANPLLGAFDFEQLPLACQP